NSTVGFAFSKGPFSFFAAGSGTLWSAGRKNHERAGLAFGGFLGWGASLIAPIKRSFFDGLLTTDLILGASLKHDSVGAVGVGYLASQGFFTNLTEHHVRLFATSLISEGFSPDRFPYLNAGISQFDWLLGKELEKKIGYISPYFRQNIFLKSPINFDGKAPESQQGEAPSNPIAKDILLRTLNLDRYGAGDYVDVRLSYAIDPKPQLYEASLVLHTLDFLPERYLLQQAGKDILGGARLTLGVINLPELYYYTVPGGMKPRAQIDAMVYLPDIGFRFYTTFGVNATETLSVLPFAQNALFMGITLNYIAKK
ncbi:MAG: hypothetical protein RMJ98_17545, partial [Myxococcales bacterium]|nr:hypothetical protein [Polyangiaceae bacterium]MDW8251100.1 hypothetical protein [Myxococcales bacterium]